MLSIATRFHSLKKNHKHAFALLVDPDSTTNEQAVILAKSCKEHPVDFIFMGGSIMLTDQVACIIATLREGCDTPIVLFPGSPTQVCPSADGLLYLSLISGRNPDLLIGQHVISAPAIKKSGLEVISTGYMVVDGGRATSVSYMSNSMPLPADKPDLALCTAWAGELQGKAVIYMDAGSGALHPISTDMISKVSQNIELPLIIGGGISTAERAIANCKAGAQVIVVGNATEKNPSLVGTLSAAVHSCN